MKRFTVVIDRPTLTDIEVSYAWGVNQWGGQLAQEWLLKLENTITSLDTMPQRHSIAPESNLFDSEIRQVLFGRYRILFTIVKQTVHILHVRGAYTRD